mgnify:CR=1 FL=1
MRIPRIRGIIDRRILLNYRVRPWLLEGVLPPPFRPQVVNGWAIAGICLIRLIKMRTALFSLPIGARTENAAHRIAVTWESHGRERSGVYIPRRDSNSRLNTWVGGRLFPGVHHLATFDVREGNDHYSISMRSQDGHAALDVVGRVSNDWPADSVFASLDEASQFFKQGSLGYSATRRPNEFDGLTLECENWSCRALAVEKSWSTFFEQNGILGSDEAVLDCALLMTNISHSWSNAESMCCDAVADAPRETLAAR